MCARSNDLSGCAPADERITVCVTGHHIEQRLRRVHTMMRLRRCGRWPSRGASGAAEARGALSGTGRGVLSSAWGGLWMRSAACSGLGRLELACGGLRRAELACGGLRHLLSSRLPCGVLRHVLSSPPAASWGARGAPPAVC